MNITVTIQVKTVGPDSESDSAVRDVERFFELENLCPMRLNNTEFVFADIKVGLSRMNVGDFVTFKPELFDEMRRRGEQGWLLGVEVSVVPGQVFEVVEVRVDGLRLMNYPWLVYDDEVELVEIVRS